MASKVSERRIPEGKIVVVGAGGFGREVLDVIEDLAEATNGRLEVCGVTDNEPDARNLDRLQDRGIPYLGSDSDWLSQPDAELFAVAVGNPSLRARLVVRYLSAGLAPVTLIHPTVTIGRRTHIAEGVIICAGATVSTNVEVGRFVTINANASVGHDACLANFVSVNPGAVVSGAVSIGERSLVGAGSVILENRSVGRECVVGASACVTHDVPDGAVVVGVPARELRGDGTSS